VPGAGTFAQTFYAYGELLRNDSRVYGGPIFSEGTYHWLYAGLADGNYALAYDGRPLAKEPLLPVFDLYQIHPKECDIGMGWTVNFCDAIPDWRKPENLDRAIDRFLLHTLRPKPLPTAGSRSNRLGEINSKQSASPAKASSSSAVPSECAARSWAVKPSMSKVSASPRPSAMIRQGNPRGASGQCREIRPALRRLAVRASRNTAHGLRRPV
jgi:hypothetical protein